MTVNKLLSLLARDKRTPEQRETDARVDEFWRRDREKRRRSTATFTLTRAQRAFANKWKQENRTPEEKWWDERNRADAWKFCAIILAWLLFFSWTLLR